MKIEQIYTGCLAHAAYYIENQGEAAIFDPLRETQPYIDRALKDNVKIKMVMAILNSQSMNLLLEKRNHRLKNILTFIEDQVVSILQLLQMILSLPFRK
jgi:hypothetical protein